MGVKVACEGFYCSEGPSQSCVFCQYGEFIQSVHAILTLSKWIFWCIG